MADGLGRISPTETMEEQWYRRSFGLPAYIQRNLQRSQERRAGLGNIPPVPGRKPEVPPVRKVAPQPRAPLPGVQQSAPSSIPMPQSKPAAPMIPVPGFKPDAPSRAAPLEPVQIVPFHEGKGDSTLGKMTKDAAKEGKTDDPKEIEERVNKALLSPETSNVLTDLGLSLMANRRDDFLGALGEAGLATTAQYRSRKAAKQKKEMEERKIAVSEANAEAYGALSEAQAEQIKQSKAKIKEVMTDRDGNVWAIGQDGSVKEVLSPDGERIRDFNKNDPRALAYVNMVKNAALLRGQAADIIIDDELKERLLFSADGLEKKAAGLLEEMRSDVPAGTRVIKTYVK